MLSRDPPAPRFAANESSRRGHRISNHNRVAREANWPSLSVHCLSKEGERKNFMSMVWLITGSGNGLGRDIAEAALAAGDSVVAGARRTEEPAEHLA
jgi:hypothetical protein